MCVKHGAVDDLPHLTGCFFVTTTKFFDFPQQVILTAELAEMLHSLLRLVTRTVDRHRDMATAVTIDRSIEKQHSWKLRWVPYTPFQNFANFGPQTPNTGP